MKSSLILDVGSQNISIALTEDDRLVEYNNESRTASFSVGNIYLARVKKLMPGLNAAFVDLGYEKEAFLHYLDIGSQFYTINDYIGYIRANKKKITSMQKVRFNKTELSSNGSIADVLSVGQEILVQIAKEPISTKGPRLTAELSLAGRFLVLIPFSNKISISQKITSVAEKKRLKRIVHSAKLNNYGVIVRTASEGKSDKELVGELKLLSICWEQALASAQKAVAIPNLVFEELGRAEAILRDHFNPDFENIVVNDKTVYEELRSYISRIEPSKKSIVKLYNDDLPIYDVYNITKQLRSSFGKFVPMKRSSYLVIEHTEACHVIDVNSGIRIRSGNKQEDNALEVNMLAADEIARQLRLRDMGGIVIIDFIDMHKTANKQALYERMVANMHSDNAKHNVLPLSKFGLMQITRQRVRPVMQLNIEEKCPTCLGKGSIRPSIMFTEVLQTKIELVKTHLKVKRFKLFVHPYVYAYLNQGVFSLKFKWRMKYGLGLRIYENQSLSFMQYKFIDSAGNELNVTDSIEMQ